MDTKPLGVDMRTMPLPPPLGAEMAMQTSLSPPKPLGGDAIAEQQTQESMPHLTEARRNEIAYLMLSLSMELVDEKTIKSELADLPDPDTLTHESLEATVEFKKMTGISVAEITAFAQALFSGCPNEIASQVNAYTERVLEKLASLAQQDPTNETETKTEPDQHSDLGEPVG